MTYWALLFFLLLWGAPFLYGQDPKPEGLHGQLKGDVHWCGEVLVDGDLQIDPQSTLSIAAGTLVHIAERDVTKGGWNPELVEMHIKGRVDIVGSAANPVRFLSANPTGSWHGLVLQSKDESAKPSVIESTYFSGAISAIQVPMGAPRIRDCVFINCVTGIEVGSAYANRRVLAISGNLATPEVQGCRFSSCETGIFAELNGSPDIRNCVFYRCTTGLGNDRKGLSYQLYDPGCIVERCALINNQSAIRGQALVRNSIFLKNTVVLRLSNFHARYSTQIDHVAMQSNLFWRNRTRIQGETGLNITAITGDPAFVGPLDDLGGPGVALLPCLKLKPNSAARNMGADGGDLGPFGFGAGQKDQLCWQTSGEKVKVFQMLPMKRNGQEVKLKRILRGRPNAGKKVGKQWWVSPALGKQGELDVIECFGKSNIGLYLYFAINGDKGSHSLELNGDVETVDIFLNGKEVYGLKTRRRFSSAGISFHLPLKKGTNRVLLRLQTWGSRPRFGCAIHGPAKLEEIASSPIGTMKSAKARLFEKSGRRSIVVTTGSPLNWTDTGKINLVEILNARGRIELGTSGMRVKILSKSKLRISGLSPRAIKGMQLRLKGLHNPDGQEYPTIDNILVR